MMQVIEKYELYESKYSIVCLYNGKLNKKVVSKESQISYLNNNLT